jgi:hypothetical protein
MSKTAVGLFQNPAVANRVVHDLQAKAFPSEHIRVVGEPIAINGSDASSTPRLDFEVGLDRELLGIGATQAEADAYIQGVRRGGVLVLARGSDEAVDNAAQVMNLHGAVQVEELVGVGASPSLAMNENAPDSFGDSSTQTGRISQPGDGARVFVW